MSRLKNPLFTYVDYVDSYVDKNKDYHFTDAKKDPTSGFYYGEQAKKRLQEYKAKREKIQKKKEEKKNTAKKSTLGSKTLGPVTNLATNYLYKPLTKLLSSSFCNTIPSIFNKIELGISFLFGLIGKLERGMLKFCQALYIPKCILLVTILLIALSEFLSRRFDESEILSRRFDWLRVLHTEKVLQAVYSIAKLINVIIIFIAVLMGVSKVIEKTDNNEANMPFPLLLVVTLVGSMPILYELLSLLALSSITLAYYSQKCNGKITNTWDLVDKIGGTLLAFGVIGIVVSFLQFRFKKACTGKPGEERSLQAPNVLMLSSLGYFIVLMLASGFELTVSKNVSYWMGLMGDKENPFEDCVKNDEYNKEEDGMEKVLNIMLSIAISTLLLIIIVIGVLPPIGPLYGLSRVNMQMREKIGDLINKIFSLLLQ
tara:strand:- start:1279 stop:2562 length:1284 start_codon:yes stop_codon:yes gene_type:complete